MFGIAAVIMVKNEEKRIHVTIDSVRPYVDALIIYDTGSTDKTLDVIKSYDIPLYLHQGTFEDFATSRNVLLEFADKVAPPSINYYLLMDSNDELKGGEELVAFLSTFKGNACYVKQTWLYQTLTSYYNIRLIRARSNWRYVGVVHEYIRAPEGQEENDTFIPDTVVIYQDKTLDNEKSVKRYSRDYALLKDDFEKNPTNPRSCFYLAQTCFCLGRYPEAIRYYKLRTIMGSFHEEVYYSLYRIGEIYEKLEDEDNALLYYNKAFIHTPRAEPLYNIAVMYRNKNNFTASFYYAIMASHIPYPTHLKLFISQDVYEYSIYHLLGIVSYYTGNYTIGIQACQRAISSKNLTIDKENLTYYQEPPKSY
jgi:glycosyltransferase involved in cell wall biosynthesis